MVICLVLGADLHMAQLMPLPLTVSCFSKIQIGFTFLVPAHPGSTRKRAVKRVCVCVMAEGSLQGQQANSQLWAVIHITVQMTKLGGRCQKLMNLCQSNTHTHTHARVRLTTTQVSRYEKGKTNLDFTEARDSEWQWHQLGHMQVCTSHQTDNHTSTPPLSFLQAGCPSCRPTNSIRALSIQHRTLYITSSITADN